MCRAHGGSAPQVSAAAARRQLDATAARALARLDVNTVADPLTALSLLAGQVIAWKDALAEQVNELTSVRYIAAGAGTEQLRAEVALFERAMDRCAAVLGAMARLRIDERLVTIQQAQAEIVIRAIEAALASVGVNAPADKQTARAAAARVLRAVA